MLYDIGAVVHTKRDAEIVGHPRAPTASPVTHAAILAEGFARKTEARTRRHLGQIFTPPEIARFMSVLAGEKAGHVRVLDPGAGTGILASALCESLTQAERIDVDAYEIDPDLAALCSETLDQVRKWVSPRGTQVSFQVHNQDFIWENASSVLPTLLDVKSETRRYDFAILNPPYFKLGTKDYRLFAASKGVHGQPNIYALFMTVTAGLLSDAGVMVAIVPRSFATGAYFRRFRQTLFSMVAPEAVHVFESRKEAFRDDGVLQENVILKLRRGAANPTGLVQISKSAGLADLGRSAPRSVPIDSILAIGSRNLWFTVPECDNDDAIVQAVKGWPCRLRDLGLEISTGPVVAFRARKFLHDHENASRSTVPLLWMNSVRSMKIEWPVLSSHKPQYIEASNSSQRLLVPNSRYVLLRRFTSKEEPRRLTAAPLMRDELPGKVLGLENHINYIYRPGGEMDSEEAVGLAALLNSRLVDRYFRLSSGSTQVNAVEMRDLPLPPPHAVRAIGEAVLNRGEAAIEEQVEEAAAAQRRLITAFPNGEA